MNICNKVKRCELETQNDHIRFNMETIVPNVEGRRKSNTNV